MALYDYVLVQHIRLVSVALGVIAVIQIWAGMGLLQRRAWARPAIQVLIWLWAVFTLLLAVGQWVALLTIPGVSTFSRGFGIAHSVLMTVISVIAAAAALRYLRSAEARAAVAGR